MDLKKITVGFGFTGSFCTISSVINELKNLVDNGIKVYPVISFNVKELDNRFNNAAELKNTIEEICNNKVIDTIQGAEPFGPKKLVDAFIISPCTGNTISKLCNGITDTPVTMAAKATLRNNNPVVVSISTNDGLSASAKNIGALLNTKNYYFVPFGQDDYKNKQTSLVADNSLIIPTLREALEQRQIQPVLI